MRHDVAPGAVFPDNELPDQTGKLRKLSELQGDDPLILTLARGHYCPKRTPAASGTRLVLSKGSRGVHAGRHDFNRRPPHPPGVSSVGRSRVDILFRPRPNRSEGPRDPGVHRP
jgi:hypothetical protein